MPNRREFLGGLLGIGAAQLSGALGIAARGSAHAGTARLLLEGRARSLNPFVPDQRASFGSGYFGEWITDEFGLPAYRYTCNQIIDPKARTPVHKEWRSQSDHTHQVGNDRLVASVSNYGYVQVRQDEGSPKFLNDYSPEDGRYGGGIGFLTDGDILLSTYYQPGNAASFERVFGVGYLKKTVKGGPYEINQVILAPFGDDPVLISQVTITNHGREPRELRWIEYWGCHPYQFSYRSFMEAALQGGVRRCPELRREFGARFAHDFRALPNGDGLLERKHFLGRSQQEEQSWLHVASVMKANPTTSFGGPIPNLAPGAAFDDLNPPATFLASLDAPVDGMGTNSNAFFGAGGMERPSGILSGLRNDLTSAGPESALMVERRLHLSPGRSRTLYFLYGYLPEGFDVQGLAAKYKASCRDAWRDSSTRWKADGPRLRVESEPWVERETLWHNYYLRGSLTYDSFFREHILSQGHVYQYIIGFQGAARDPLQHAMPLVFSEPGIVREVLRYTLKEIQPDGSIPYGIVGSGVPMPAPYRPSDLEMWVLWLASEYVLATRDKEFLDKIIPSYPARGNGSGGDTGASGPGGAGGSGTSGGSGGGRSGDARPVGASVRELLARSFTHLENAIGVGEHGLMRLSNGDWNDSLVVGNISPALHAEIQQSGESILNAAMASYVLDHYARLLSFIGDSTPAVAARAAAEGQRQAVQAQWNGEWFRRAWLGSKLGWVGEKDLWLEPQPWAIIGGAATPAQATTLVGAVDKLVRKPSPIGAMLQGGRISQMGLTPGVLTNGGIWPSINGTLIWALAMTDGAMAWDEWKKNSLAFHAEAYKEVWYGIWSGPDSYNSTLSKHPGQTMFAEPGSGFDWGVSWTDFPVMNLHPHAWPLYSAAKLLGLEFNEAGLSLRPVLPVDRYEFSSPLVGFRKTGASYSGWYAPARAGRWVIELRLPRAELKRARRLEVNGVSRDLPNNRAGADIDVSKAASADGGERAKKSAPNGARSIESLEGSIRFKGDSQVGKPLRWAID